MSSSLSSGPAGTTSQRITSVDALRGFDMFWILGGGTLVGQLDQLLNSGGSIRYPWLRTLSLQFEHVDWEGFRFYDLIFPLFVFIVGVSLVFSLSRQMESHGRWAAFWRVFRRSLLLFVLGIFVTGGLSQRWPDVAVSGVLHRIALCSLFAGTLFILCRPRALATVLVAILLGYWAILAWTPIPKIQFEEENLRQLARERGTDDIHELIASTPDRVTGSYEKGLNLANYLDVLYLPGRKYDKYWAPEGLLSTIPAVATCLLGVFAGLLLRNPLSSHLRKVLYLALAGLAGLALGYYWGEYFPIIKKIWTSSYVLVAGGYSALLLAAFYLLIDVWGWRWWSLPFVWLGMNSITVYVLRRPLVDFGEAARRLVGGDVAWALDNFVAAGTGELVQTILAFVLVFLLARFLYQRKIFLRV